VKKSLFSLEPFKGSFSTSEQLFKLEGKWHDPTGVLLGEREEVIWLKKKEK